MSPLAARVGQVSLRAACRTSSSPAQVRTLYTTREHVAHNNFPFSYADKRKFAVKMGLSLGTAFLVPFIACGYQLSAMAMTAGSPLAAQINRYCECELRQRPRV